MFCNTISVAQKKNIDSVLVKIIESTVSPHILKTHPSSYRSYLLKLKPGIKKERLVKNGIQILRTIDQRLIIIQANQHALSHIEYEEIWPVNHLWKLSDDLLLNGDKTRQKLLYNQGIPPSSDKYYIFNLPD
jgi:hypothetical protein